MEQHSFGYWLKRKRKALDLTREELAERIGYSAATVRKIEDEERRPSAQIAERLAELFNIPQNERESFLSFARGDWKSAPADADEGWPWRAPGKSPRSNIPATTTSLIGRASEIAFVREYLSNQDIRLVTLMGPPGIGKTRLSIEAARAPLQEFPDGVDGRYGEPHGLQGRRGVAEDPGERTNSPPGRVIARHHDHRPRAVVDRRGVSRRDRALLLEQLPRAGFEDIAPADGAFYIYADIGRLSNDSEQFCRDLLARDAIAMTPGTDFDPERGRRFVRKPGFVRTSRLVPSDQRIRRRSSCESSVGSAGDRRTA